MLRRALTAACLFLAAPSPGEGGADGRPVARKLTDHPAEDRTPSWSPDGQRLVFVSERDGNRELYSIAADGTGTERLTDDPATDQGPAWSPDGARIAFQSDRRGQPGLWVLELKTRESWLLLADGSPELTPDWSPDGRFIAFTAERDGNLDLYRIEVESRRVERLTDHPERDLWPRYSPDGGSLVFFSRRDSGGQIDDLYRLDLTDRSVTRLTDHPTHHDFVPDESPHPGGGLVAGYSDRAAGVRALAIHHSDGREIERFATGYHRVAHPAWSPDGRSIAYTARVAEEKAADLYIVEIEPAEP